MVIQTDSYPCVGYQQQQAHAIHQEGSWYPPKGYHSIIPGMPMPMPPTTTKHSNHHMMVDGGYAQQQEWLSGKDKHQTDHHMMVSEGYAQPQEWWSGKDKHQTDHHMMVSEGYAQPQERWNCSGKDKHQTGWHGATDQYSSYGYNSNSNVSNRGGYGTYHEGRFPGPPAATTKVQVVEYPYGGAWGGGDGARSQVYDQQYPSKGCQKVEYWAVKGV